MRLKRLFVVGAAGMLTIPAYWHTVSATELGDYQCFNNVDDDGDGRVDYNGGTPPVGAPDPDCDGPDDNTEAGPLGEAPPPGDSSSSSRNNNTNTSDNSNTNTSNSTSSAGSGSQSSSTSTACVALCDASALTNLLSSLPLLGR